jgi:hypothetical protein
VLGGGWKGEEHATIPQRQGSEEWGLRAEETAARGSGTRPHRGEGSVAGTRGQLGVEGLEGLATIHTQTNTCSGEKERVCVCGGGVMHTVDTIEGSAQAAVETEKSGSPGGGGGGSKGSRATYPRC